MMVRWGLIGMLCLSLAAQAEIYKWVDAQGRVHYSDTPPPDRPARTLDVEGAPTHPEEAGEVAERYLRQWQRLKLEDAQRRAARALAEAEARERKIRCDELAHKIRVIDQKYPFYRIREDGSYEYLSDEEIAARRKVLAARHDAECR